MTDNEIRQTLSPEDLALALIIARPLARRQMKFSMIPSGTVDTAADFHTGSGVDCSARMHPSRLAAKLNALVPPEET